MKTSLKTVLAAVSFLLMTNWKLPRKVISSV